MPLASATIFKAGAALTATGITTGAFGAHMLAERLGPKLSSWHTASTYAMINGVSLLALSQHPIANRKLAPTLIMAGTTLFSGSIFALLLLGDKIPKRLVGPLTPIGGVLLISGYVSLLF